MRVRVGFNLVWLVSIATAAFAQVTSETETFKNYTALQTGLEWRDSSQRMTFGVAFGETIHPNVRAYSTLKFGKDLNGGQKATSYYTGGAKYLFPTSTKVTPYLLGGLGGLHISETKVDDVTVLKGLNKFVVEVGAGIEVNFGRRGFFDAGFRRLAVPSPQLPHVLGYTNNLLVEFGARY